MAQLGRSLETVLSDMINSPCSFEMGRGAKAAAWGQAGEGWGRSTEQGR